MRLEVVLVWWKKGYALLGGVGRRRAAEAPPAAELASKGWAILKPGRVSPAAAALFAAAAAATTGATAAAAASAFRIASCFTASSASASATHRRSHFLSTPGAAHHGKWSTQQRIKMHTVRCRGVRSP